VQKYSGQNFVTFGLPKLSNKRRISWFCDQNPSKWFVDKFLSFSISTSKNISVKTLSLLVFPNFETNPEWVGFAHKTPLNDLWSSSYHSPSVRPKNIPLKTLLVLVFPKLAKLPKLSNNPRMNWFCPQNHSDDFWSSFYRSPSVRLKNIPVKTLLLLVFPNFQTNP